MRAVCPVCPSFGDKANLQLSENRRRRGTGNLHCSSARDCYSGESEGLGGSGGEKVSVRCVASRRKWQIFAFGIFSLRELAF